MNNTLCRMALLRSKVICLITASRDIDFRSKSRDRPLRFIPEFASIQMRFCLEKCLEKYAVFIIFGVGDVIKQCTSALSLYRM